MRRHYDDQKPPFDANDRRVPPPYREEIFSEEERRLARAVLSEIKKHLGIHDAEEWREERGILREILPMLQTMHEAYKFRRDLWAWWLGMAGKTLLSSVTFIVVIALAYGLVPAVRLAIHQAIGP